MKDIASGIFDRVREPEEIPVFGVDHAFIDQEIRRRDAGRTPRAGEASSTLETARFGAGDCAIIQLDLDQYA